MKEYKILSPTGIVGYGFPEDSFLAGVALKPDLIACDAGSTDPGPYYLGSGIPFTNAVAVERDLTLMLRAACSLGIPLVVGSSGGSGATPHLQREIDLVAKIAKKHSLTFKMAAISAEFDKGFLAAELRKGRIHRLGVAPLPTEKDIQDSAHIVAQMGIEPIIHALDDGAQLILCGRAYDPAPFAAPPIRLGYPEAPAFHLGKILECACICATPGSGSDCIMGYLSDDHFAVEPLSPHRACTPLSVSSHTLYEKSNPYLLPGPGGTLDIQECSFSAESDRRVCVTGARFMRDRVPNVKLEGAKPVGYRSISIAGNRDPVFIAHLDDVLEGVKHETAANLSADYDYALDFIVYGKNGVMGPLEPQNLITSHEVGIIIDVVSETQEYADAVCSVARSTLLHHGYEGRIATAGNLAFPFSPSDIKVGPVYNFSVYALLECNDPASLFPRTYYHFVEGRNHEKRSS